MDYHLLRSFTLAMHVPPHDKNLENHITFPKESENTTLSTCKHCCLNRECAEYTIYYYQCIETSHRPRFKSKLSQTRQKKLANKHIRIMSYSPSGRLVVKILFASRKNGRKCDWASANFTPCISWYVISAQVCQVNKIELQAFNASSLN